MSIVKNLKGFKDYITINGVGQNDKVANSVNSYVSYIKHVAEHSGVDVTSDSLKNDEDINYFISELKISGKVSNKTIKNYVSAMKQYVKMVQENA
jgi:site-specific recombinase XerD